MFFYTNMCMNSFCVSTEYLILLSFVLICTEHLTYNVYVPVRLYSSSDIVVFKSTKHVTVFHIYRSCIEDMMSC